MPRRLLAPAIALGVTATVLPAGLAAQTLGADFSSAYSTTTLGTPTGVPAQLGGLTFLAGDANTLLIGGSANQPGGAIYSIGVVRDPVTHSITGFSGPASVFATAPNIDGGLSYGPGGVLFATGYPNNTLLQYLPGSSAPDKIINLSSLPGTDVSSSVGGLAFVPSGYPGAGGLKIFSYTSNRFYSAVLTADGSGTYDISDVILEATLGGGLEGMVYVPMGSAGFTSTSVLVTEYSSGKVGAYDVDADGNPIVGTRRDFITGLNGAEGAVIDPLTGDFLFSTFGGGNHVVRVSGFAAPPVSVTPEPSTFLLAGTGLFAVAAAARRRRRGARQLA
ncbi:MAG TPA: PEP-CTERM sorting domain-containing protein [Gemmatimonadaceae bacterium]|nr:PEP-CTERM sorting domain-containing protein [Gemmatimonadaceae bacterium]